MFLIVLAMVIVILPAIFMKKFLQSVEVLMMWTSSIMKQDFRSYCSLEIPMDETTLSRKDGGLVTFLKLKGTISVVGAEEFIKTCERIDAMQASQMRDAGHDIQIVFRQDDEASARLIDEAYAPTRASCARMGLSIDDLLDSDVETLARIVGNEECWLILSTVTDKLDATSIKDRKFATSEHIKSNALPNLGDAQNPAALIPELSTPHDSFVNAVKLVFDECGIRTEIVGCHGAIHGVRKEIDTNLSPKWMPSLPGDRTPADASRRSSQNFDDWSDLFYPPLWSQICKEEAEVTNGLEERVKIGGRYYGSIAIDLPPQSPEKFSVLLERMKKAGIPFRISYRIYPNGLNMIKFNRTLVGFLSMFPKSYNARIKGAIDFLEENSRKNNDPAMGVAIAMTTWADDEKLLSKRLQNAQRILQGWGGADVTLRSGDAMELFASTIPGFSSSVASRVMLFPASELSGILPLERPSSIWDFGAVPFTSIDNKLMPYQPGSSQQTTWVSLIFAPPGKGKSVLLNTLQLACCIAPGIARLPLMTVIDVGESVSGLIDLIKSGLPPSREHEAGYFKLQMKPEFSVNVMDTQLGFRFPRPEERDFIVSFLAMLATPAGRVKPYESVYEMLGLVVDELYSRYSDRETPKKYERGVDKKVDLALDSFNFSPDESASWYEVVDELFRRGMVIEAARAQRFAVPIISDVPSVLNSTQVKDIYGKIVIEETREFLPDFVSRMIASSLREYKIFGSPTQWDLSNCRVIGIDLNDVRGPGESGKKQTALMYAFSQNVASRNYYLHPEMLQDIPRICPEMYREFHKARINDVAEEVKTVSYDEFHNTGGLEGIRRIVGLNIREGRKWNIQVFLASQLIEDFDEDMVKNATSTYILSADNAVTVEQCRTTFGLTDSMVAALEKYVTAPGRFLAIYNTKQGKSVHALKNTLSPVKYWAFTTTAEDKQIRRKLYSMMPGADARRLLAKRFPSANFKSYIEKRRSAMGGEPGDDENSNVIEVIAKELYEEWKEGGAV